MMSEVETKSEIEPAGGALIERAHVFPVRVYYEDTDFTGVVYHARYLHFFERGRTEWLRALGVSHTELGDGRFGEPLAFAIRSIAVEYRHPARVDDVLQVRTSLTETKGARWLLRQDMTRPFDGAEVASADVQIVLITPQGVPRRMPKALSAIIDSR